MSESPAIRNLHLWSKHKAVYIEAIVILFIALCSLLLQHGKLNSAVLLSYHGLLTLVGSLCVWFANRFFFERILQSKIESNQITRFLPLQLLMASILVTSIIYVIVYLALIYFEKSNFVPTLFLLGFSGTIGLSLLIMLIYLAIQLWNAWWSDGEFLFHRHDTKKPERTPKDFIIIKNPKGTVNFDLNKVRYFISDSRIVFLVDTSGKKWITQYNLSELEKALDNRFFRLNRRIISSRQTISLIKKLPNHRLLVTIGPSREKHFETISRYKSTKFKQWFHSTSGRL